MSYVVLCGCCMIGAVHDLYLVAGRAVVYTVRAIEAGVIDGVVYDYSFVYIDMVYATTYVPYSCVVKEMATVPTAAYEAGTVVAEAIVDAAVVADAGTPVAPMPAVVAAIETPITGCPEQAWRWRRYPYAGYPGICAAIPIPVARCPDIAIYGAGWLHVVRDGRRGSLCLYGHR